MQHRPRRKASNYLNGAGSERMTLGQPRMDRHDVCTQLSVNEPVLQRVSVSSGFGSSVEPRQLTNYPYPAAASVYECVFMSVCVCVPEECVCVCERVFMSSVCECVCVLQECS